MLCVIIFVVPIFFILAFDPEACLFIIKINDVHTTVFLINKTNTRREDTNTQKMVWNFESKILMSFVWIRINLKSIEIRLVAAIASERERERDRGNVRWTRVLKKKYRLNFKFTLMTFFRSLQRMIFSVFFLAFFSVSTSCVNFWF